ncbi:hypothetical protein ACWDQO_00155 [Streptomyces sp. NPDC003703]|uniref:hypothetical protein n=1 Tax=Streptomyces sp. NPDC003283 TaxID=3364681 RepID=UPI0036D094FD
MQQGTALPPPPRTAVSILPLPPLTELSNYRTRGITCVWCGIGLSARKAVDLGPRELRGGGVTRWFPRGCRPCAREKAYLALFPHASLCNTGCRVAPDICPTGRDLYCLSRAGRWQQL